jgi:hypothetical protein
MKKSRHSSGTVQSVHFVKLKDSLTDHGSEDANTLQTKP